jgi:hypothetical protein
MGVGRGAFQAKLSQCVQGGALRRQRGQTRLKLFSMRHEIPFLTTFLTTLFLYYFFCDIVFGGA